MQLDKCMIIGAFIPLDFLGGRLNNIILELQLLVSEEGNCPGAPPWIHP